MPVLYIATIRHIPCPVSSRGLCTNKEVVARTCVVPEVMFCGL